MCPGSPTDRCDQPSIQRRLVALIAVVAAIPTIVWGFADAGFISDDYWMNYWLEDSGLGEGMRRIAFDSPGRPMTALYYAFIYEVVGDVPVLQVAIMASVNALLVVALWRLGRGHFPAHVVLPALLLFAVIPNHAATRLWFVAGVNVLALAIAVGGLIWSHQGKHWHAAGALAIAVLLYEGVAGLAAALMVVSAFRRPQEWRRVLVSALPMLVAAAAVYHLSPKRQAASAGGYQGPLANADSLAPAQFGSGLVDNNLLGLIVYGAVVLLITLAIVRHLPGFRSHEPVHRQVLVGLVVLVAGASPMLVGGSQFAVEGLNDRNNFVPSVGAALVIGAPFSRLLRSRPQIGLVVLVATATGLFALNFHDVALYQRSSLEGREIVATIDRTISEPSLFVGAEVVLVPEPGRGEAVHALINDIDVQGAMYAETGEHWRFMRMIASYDCEPRGATRVVYLDWRTGELSPRPAMESVAACRSRAAP